MPDDSYHFVVDNDTLDTFGELDYRIYSVVHDCGQAFLHMRVSDLAQKARVSNAAIVRFCKKCGYSGLKELKQEYANALRQNQQNKPVPTVLNELRLSFNERDSLC